MEHSKHEGAESSMRERMEKNKRAKMKMHKVMSEFKKGSLLSSSGAKVKSRKQAVAIAMSEAGHK